MRRHVLLLLLFFVLSAADLWAVVVNTPAVLPTVTRGVSWSYTLPLSGGVGPYTATIFTGSVPSGFLNAGAYTYSPYFQGTMLSVGSWTFSFYVTDVGAGSQSAERTVTIRVADPLSISTTSLPNGSSGVAYYQTLVSAGGDGLVTWGLAAGSLPPGLVLNSSGAISGTPTGTGTYNFTVRAMDQWNPTPSMQTRALSITVPQPLAIATTSLPAGMVAKTYSAAVNATGGAPPYTWSVVSGALPGGLALSGSTISGTPTTAGTFGFTIRATDAGSQAANQALSIIIRPALTITTGAALPNAISGVAYSTSLGASGGASPYTWSVVSGSLPPGLTLSGGSITGTPSAAGSYNFTAQVNDSESNSAQKAFSLAVLAPLTVTTSSLPAGMVAKTYSAPLNASGGTAPYTWSVASGSLPPGLTLSGNTIGGTPSQAGTFGFTLQASDAGSQSASRTFSIVIAPALTITSSTPLPGAATGAPYAVSLNATGGTPPYTWSVASGSLPQGLTVSGNTISGTAISTGTFEFSIRATDSESNAVQKAFSISVAPPLVLSTAMLPNGLQAQAYSAALTASGGVAPYSWSVSSGALPPGLTLSGGSLTGTPTAPGSYNFSLQVADSLAPPQTASRSFTISVASPLSVTSASPLPNGLATTAYSINLVGTGGTPPYTWSLAAGSPPAGLFLSPTGLLSGTPLAATTATFSVQISDSGSPAQIATKALTLTVGEALSITTTAVSDALATSPYSQSVSATGGTAPYAWSVTAGALPPGVALSGNTISGTPSTPGSYSFTLRATDATSPTPQTASQPFTITVYAALAITTAATLPHGVVGTTYTQSLEATGGTAPYTWTLESGSVPPGFAVTPSGVVTGYPTAPGEYSFTVRVSDSTSPTPQTISKSFTIVIAEPLTITTPTIPASVQGHPYSASLAATGGIPPYTWSVSFGSLPPGLTLAAGTGEIGGTPSAAGTFSFTIKVTDSQNNTATRAFNLTLAPALSIEGAVLPTALVGTPYSHELSASGGRAPYTWSVTSGTLPDGLSLNSTGGLAGVPTAAGTYTFTVMVTDSTAEPQTATQELTLRVVAPLVSPGGALPDGVQGISYSAALVVSGGTEPYNWSVTKGALPPGLSLDPVSGTITGTPATPGEYSFTVRTTDSTVSLDLSVAADYTLAIHPPLTILTTGLPRARDGKPYSHNLLANGGTRPYSWSLTSGELPPGLSLDTAGVIGGVPSTIGTYTFSVRVTDATTPQLEATAELTLAVDQGFGIDTQGHLPPGIERTFYTTALQASLGTSPYTWSLVSGALPDGLSIDPSTGVISGTPTTAGNYSFLIQATDSASTPRTATAQLFLLIQPELILHTTALPDSVVGALYSHPLITSGGIPPYTWSIASGPLPPGLALDAGGNISGFPTAQGSYTFSIRAADSSTPRQTITRSFTVTISLGVAIATPVLPDGYLDEPYNATLLAVGGTAPYLWTIASGTLPPGLGLDPSGVISGIPTASGEYTLTIRVSDSATPAQTGTKSYTLRIRSTLTITTAALPDAGVGLAYSEQLTAVNGVQPYIWRISRGSLPPGLSVDASGVLRGTPTAAGDAIFTITVTDASAPALSDSKELSLRVATGFRIITTTLPAAAPHTPYSASINAIDGVLPYAWTIVSGSLPPGITLEASTGVLTGTPTWNGTYTFTVQAADAANTLASRVFSLAVGESLRIGTAALADARVGTMYRQNLSAINGTEPYLWTLTAGQLPDGLLLLGSGDIIGQPSLPGQYTLTLTVTDSALPSASASQTFQLTVHNGFSITTESLPIATPDVPYLTALTATAGQTPYRFRAVLGSFPEGLTLSPEGVIRGTARKPGPYPLIVEATDSTTPISQTTTRQLLLIVSTDLNVTTAELPTAVIGTAYEAGLSATRGMQPYTWAADGLPTGLALLPTGEIYGTPLTAGEYTVTVSVSDSSDPPANVARTLRLLVIRNLTITTESLPPAYAGTAYSTAIVAAGGKPPYTFTSSGRLPPGMNLADTGVLSGTPAQEGAYTFAVTAHDSEGKTDRAEYTLVVGRALAITRLTLPTGISGAPYYAFLAGAGGTQPYTWSINNLPTGLSLIPSLGLIIGTPAQAGEYSLNVIVSDSASPTRTANAAVRLSVAPGLTIPPADLPAGQTGAPYITHLSAAGGTPPYRWTVDTTTLPSGLTLDSGGALQGTITAAPEAYPLPLCVSDSASPAATVCTIRTLIVGPAFSIDALTLAPVERGQTIEYQLSTSGSSGTSTFAPAFPLPSGINLSPDGRLFGAPATAGTYALTIIARDSAQQIAARDFILRVMPSFGITTVSLPTAFVHQRYAAVLSAVSGLPPYTWTAPDALPAGLSFDASGILYGVPSEEGVHPVTIHVADSRGGTVAASLSLTITQPLSITTEALPDALANTPYSAQLAATHGSAPFVWQLVAGTLPAGLALNPDGSLTGSARGAGVYVFVVAVSDNSGQISGKAVQLTIRAALSIPNESTRLPDGTVDVAYAAKLVSNYGSGVTWSVILGDLPPGLTLDAEANIAGVPTTPGTSDFIARASSDAQHTDQLYSIKVAPRAISDTTQLVITVPVLPAATTGQAYAASYTASGGTPPYAWAITSGSLPPGLLLGPEGGISGIPSAPGIYRAIVSVSDTTGQNASALCSIVVRQTLTTEPSLLSEGQLAVPHSLVLNAKGGEAPYTWTITGGALPPGLRLSDNTISGTPTVPGNYVITLAVRDSGQQLATTTLSLRIVAGLTITTATLPTAYSHVAYYATLAAVGGTQPYIWSVTSGSLPVGLTMSQAGLLTGTPAEQGAATFVATVIDATGQSVSETFTLTVAPLSITTTALPRGIPRSPYQTLLSASGGVPPYSWSTLSGALPSGLTLSRDGLLAGTPEALSETTLAIQVTDSVGARASTTLDLSISLSVGPMHLTSPPDPMSPATQTPLSLSLETAPPIELSGTLTLNFVAAQAGRDDIATALIQPAKPARRLVEFTVPAGTKTAVFTGGVTALQAGTLAGSATLTARIGEDSAESSTSATTRILAAAPVVTAARVILRDAYTVELEIDGYSTTGEIHTATFAFSGTPPLPPPNTIAVQALFDSWFQSETGKRHGGAFKYCQRLNFSSVATGLTRVSITLTNAIGPSDPFTLFLQP